MGDIERVINPFLFVFYSSLFWKVVCDEVVIIVTQVSKYSAMSKVLKWIYIRTFIHMHNYDKKMK